MEVAHHAPNRSTSNDCISSFGKVFPKVLCKRFSHPLVEKSRAQAVRAGNGFVFQETMNGDRRPLVSFEVKAVYSGGCKQNVTGVD